MMPEHDGAWLGRSYDAVSNPMRCKDSEQVNINFSTDDFMPTRRKGTRLFENVEMVPSKDGWSY